MRMMKKLSLSALSALVFALPVSAQTYFVQDATLAGTDQGQQQVSLVIENGRVTRIGANVTAPEGATTLGGAGQWVTPGIFLPLGQIGLVEISAESATNDTSADEADTSLSELAVDSFNPNSPVIDNTRVSGITHMAVVGSPSHNIFSGMGFIANTSGDFDSADSENNFIYVELGERGARIAGGSRSAAMAQLRSALADAGRYPRGFQDPDDGDTLSRRDAAGLAQAARGFMPVVIGADRASDLMRIIDLKQENTQLDIIIAGAAEGWMVADELADAGIKVIVDPLENLPNTFDRVGSRLDNAALLHEAGVEMAIFPRTAGLSHNVRVIRQHAGNAVATGLPWDAAFAAISSTPASWFGVSTGNPSDTDVAMGPATLVVWDGDPLEATSAPVFMMIEGEVQSLQSRQTELRDRYNPASGETKAHKYR